MPQFDSKLPASVAVGKRRSMVAFPDLLSPVSPRYFYHSKGMDVILPTESSRSPHDIPHDGRL